MCVPSHIHHILFEVFKNSIRATIEHFGEECVDYPPVLVSEMPNFAIRRGAPTRPLHGRATSESSLLPQVTIIKSSQDVTIRVSDRGGGIPRKNMHRAFNYLYTTAPNPQEPGSDDDDDHRRMAELGQQGVPMAGYGYGLPLSKLYAR